MAKQQSSPNNKRADMIYCERCGEDYSATYRRCPFCDERPGRRIDDHGYAARSPLRLAVLIASLVLILAAAFIVFSKVAPLLTNKDPAPTPENNPGVEEPLTPNLPSVNDPVTEDPEPVDPNAVPANAVVLSRTDMTLAPNEDFAILATVAPADTTDNLVWSCDRPDVLTVNQDGSIKNQNFTGEKVVVTVTATAGSVTAECIVRCNSGPASNTGGAVTGGTSGKVTGAGDGLNVRSGPGSNYDKVASISNGTTVTVLENTGNGWYKIDYGSGKTGYVSADYIQVSGSSGSSSSGSSGSSSSGSSGSTTTSSGVSISGKTEAKVVGATSGLNIRSGPGSNYEKVASIENGSSVVILENAGNGWYKIDYGNGKTGYASVDYIKPK